tara:strand:- start:380 stop:553 length:174 start_codon:yes stop_codon:yes gene_type:complete
MVMILARGYEPTSELLDGMIKSIKVYPTFDKNRDNVDKHIDIINAEIGISSKDLSAC